MLRRGIASPGKKPGSAPLWTYVALAAKTVATPASSEPVNATESASETKVEETELGTPLEDLSKFGNVDAKKLKPAALRRLEKKYWEHVQAEKQRKAAAAERSKKEAECIVEAERMFRRLNSMRSQEPPDEWEAIFLVPELRSWDDLMKAHGAGKLDWVPADMDSLVSVLNAEGRKADVQLPAWRKVVARVKKCEESEVTDEELFLYAGWKFTNSRYTNDPKLGDRWGLRSLRPYPGMANYWSRVEAELREGRTERGTLRRDLVPSDMEVVHFTSSGEHLVPKNIKHMIPMLTGLWANDRWKYLDMISRRADAMKGLGEQGMSGVTRILKWISFFLKSDLEAMGMSTGAYDYAFPLPFQKPHIGIPFVPNPKRIDDLQTRFDVSPVGARCHNDTISCRLRPVPQRVMDEWLWKVGQDRQYNFVSFKDNETKMAWTE